MKIKAIQHFSKEYLESCKNIEPKEILEFLENFRQMQQKSQNTPSKLISIKVPLDLLENFRFKAKLHNIPYQTQIKNLMRQWLSQDE